MVESIFIQLYSCTYLYVLTLTLFNNYSYVVNPSKEGKRNDIQTLLVFSLFSIFIGGCTQEKNNAERKIEQTTEVSSSKPSETEQAQSEPNQQQDSKNSNIPTSKTPSYSPTDNANRLSTQEDVITNIKEQIQGSLPPKLPKQLPVSSKDMLLSAAIDVEPDSYRVIFFESKKDIPIDNKALNDPNIAKPIAKIAVRRYKTELEAESKVGYFSPTEIPTDNPIDLGHSISGYTEGGTGNKWLNWHEGRWSLQVHASNVEGKSDYVPLAKNMVDYLEHNKLPVPHKYGSVKADIEEEKAENNSVSWQEGMIVYTISNVKDPLAMLEIASRFDNTGQ